MADTIESLEVELKKLNAEVREVKLQLHELRIQEASNKWGIAVGDVVMYEDCKWLVDKINYTPIGRPWLMGFKEKKKGGWGKRAQYIFRKWEKITEV